MKKIVFLFALCILLSGCFRESDQKPYYDKPVLHRLDVQQIKSSINELDVRDTGYRYPAIMYDTQAFGIACTLFSKHFCCYSAYENYVPICMSYHETENAWTVYFSDSAVAFPFKKALWVTLDSSGKVISMPASPSDTILQSKEKQAQQRLNWTMNQIIQYKNIPIPENRFHCRMIPDAQTALDVACDHISSNGHNFFRKNGYWYYEPFRIDYNEAKERWIIAFGRSTPPGASYAYAGGERDFALDANTAEVLSIWGEE